MEKRSCSAELDPAATRRRDRAFKGAGLTEAEGGRYGIFLQNKGWETKKRDFFRIIISRTHLCWILMI